MDIFITGGSGFLGRNVVARLLDVLPHSARLTLADRSFERAPVHPLVRHIYCDVRHDGPWLDAMADAHHVIWMAANRDHFASDSDLYVANVGSINRAIARLSLGSRIKSFIYTSSVSAIDQSVRPFRPMTDSVVGAPTTSYGRSKREAEQSLLHSGLPIAIFRLPFLYGPGFGPKTYLAWYESLVRGKLTRRISFQATLSLLFARDVADLFNLILRDPARRPYQPMLVSDGGVYEVDHLLDLVANVIGEYRPKHRVSLPAATGAMLPSCRLRYWRHAALTRDYFVVDSSTFCANFPDMVFTPLVNGMFATFESGRDRGRP